MEIRHALMMLAKKEDLPEELETKCFQNLFEGKLSPVQAAAFLFGLRVKGENAKDLFCAVNSALKYANKIDLTDVSNKLIDTCGTGGDGKMSFNCSTAVALFLANMGYKVVKHGNRSVSSKCGSADILEALNIPFLKDKDEIKNTLEKENFVFLFAPYFHPAFANVAGIRKELGVPTIFNIMGPLLNPANPTHQLIGVGDKKYMQTVAEVLKKKQIKRAAVVHGDGFDEITPTGETDVLLINGEIKPMKIIPEDFDIKRCSPDKLQIRDREHSLNTMKLLMEGKAPQPIKDMVSLNLGMAIYLLEEEISLKDAVDMARDKVNRGF